MENWIDHACKTRAYRRVALWTLLTLCLLALLVENKRYWKGFFFGPYSITAADLAKIQTVHDLPQDFISITGDKVVDTGVQQIITETRNGAKVGSEVSGYYALVLGTRFVVVKDGIPPAPHVEGELDPMESKLSDMLFGNPSDPELLSRAYPFVVTTGSYRSSGYFVIVAVLLFGALLWFFALPALRSARDISQHPAVKRVAAWTHPAETALQAAREMNSLVMFKSAGVTLTGNFIIRMSFFTFNIFPLDDLVWSYKEVTRGKGGKSFDAMLQFHGGSETFRASQPTVDGVLIFLGQRAPWAVMGYSAEIAKAFAQDNANFCAFVEQKRTAKSRIRPET